MSSLFAELRSTVARGKADGRRAAAAAEVQPRSSLVCDIQGIHAKHMWKSVMEEEGCWREASSLLLSKRMEAGGTHNCTSGSDRNFVDFAAGSGMRGKRARVSRFDRRFQSLFCNKRRQHHWLDQMRPRVIPETHFSLASAARGARRLMPSTPLSPAKGAQNPDVHGGELWFVKAPGKQRGTGIQVVASSTLCGDYTSANDGNSSEHSSVDCSKRISNNFLSMIDSASVFQRGIAGGDIACVNGHKADLRMYPARTSERQEVYMEQCCRPCGS